MDKVKEAGWKDGRHAQEGECEVITEVNIKTIFEAVDADKSGDISKRVGQKFFKINLPPLTGTQNGIEISQQDIRTKRRK